MMKLQYFYIEGCDELEELPRHITNQPSLAELYCVTKRLMEVPVSIGQLRKLERIRIGGELLTSLPTSMGDLSSLTSLTISQCPKLQCLPDSLGSLHLLRSLVIRSSGLQSLPRLVGQLVNLQVLVIHTCPISELDLEVGLFTSLMNIVVEATEVSKISISEDSCPVLERLSLRNNTNLTHIQVLPNSLQYIELEGNPKLEALPSFAQSAFLREFKLEDCGKVKKTSGLEHCRALEMLKVDTMVESLEGMERLRRVEIKAISRSVVEGCIQSIKKWPRGEIIVCAQAGRDATSLVRSIVFPNLCVVDSFSKRKIKSDPSLKLPGSTAYCILLCYVLNCESAETSFAFAVSEENSRVKSYFGDYGRMKLEKGKWMWTGLFTQHSNLHSSMSHNRIRVHILNDLLYLDGEEKKGEVEGVVVTGEEGLLQKAFSHLLASL